MAESEAVEQVESVTVSIMGKDYRVACPVGEQDSLLRSARFLDQRMREIRDAGVSGSERIAVMAALNLSHDYLAESDSGAGSSADSSAVKQMIDRIDREIAAHTRSS